MISFRRLPPLGFALLLALLAACGEPERKVEAAKSVDDRFPIRIGDRVVQLQVAVRPGELQKGLMFRPVMGEDEGMIFIFERPQIMGFWMRNTLIPLDIGYFNSDGELKEIYPMYQHDERPVKSTGARQIAVEMNQGWFAARGVKAGARIDLNALKAAIRARGISPDLYDLN